MNRILIFDFNNMFIRSYIVDPSLSLNGVPIGGLAGSLKSAQKIIRETKPSQIIVVWDGPGGSQRRKEKNKNYKEGRSPLRLNRSIKENLTAGEEDHNKIYQMTRLFEYFEHMPIYQLIFDGVEADDVIAHIAQSHIFQDDQKIIVSSDKDFIQLLDDRTLLYRPTQKEVLNIGRTIERYNIHPINFVVARACCGEADKSDGFKGAKGVGIKGMSQRFPLLAEAKFQGLDYVFGECKKKIKEGSKVKMYQKIMDNEKIIRQNYSLMQLFSPKMSIQDKKECDQMLQEKHSPLNQTHLLKMMIHDNFGSWNWSTLTARFNKILLEQEEKKH